MTTDFASTRCSGERATLVQPSCFMQPYFDFRGAEVQRAGVRTSARGSIQSSTAKKAISDWLDPQVAALKKGANADLKGGKGNTPKPKNEAEKAMKELQKDIKAFLG